MATFRRISPKSTGASRTASVMVAGMMAAGLLAGCGPVHTAGDTVTPTPALAAVPSKAPAANAPEPHRHAPLADVPPDSARAPDAQAVSPRGSHRSGGHRHGARDHTNYEYHNEDVLSAPPKARNAPQWNEQLQPEYHRHLGRIDDTVHDIRQRSRLEKQRRDNALRAKDKASRIPSPTDHFDRFERNRRGSSRYRF